MILRAVFRLCEGVGPLPKCRKVAIQVVTRFVTTCLALYWYMAELVIQRHSVQGKLVLVHCTVWAWTGLVLFPNFYPWT